MQCLGGQLIDEHKRWSTSAKDLLRSKDALRQHRNGKPLHITTGSQKCTGRSGTTCSLPEL